MSLELVPIPFDKLEASRGHWYPFLEKIAKRQRCTVEQRLADIYSGNVALILVWDTEKQEARALCGYSILNRGNRRAWNIVWLVGRGAAEWVHLYSTLEQFAKNSGCAQVMTLARPGWSKVLKEFGFHLTHVEYEKDLWEASKTP